MMFSALYHMLSNRASGQAEFTCEIMQKNPAYPIIVPPAYTEKRRIRFFLTSGVMSVTVEYRINLQTGR